MPELIVEHEGKGERIDRFLVRHLTGKSRSQIQKLLESGAVQLNGKPTKPHHSVKPGDRISFEAALEIAEEPQLRNVPTPSLVFEDDNFLVINKPSGLIVHPGAGVRGPTLIDWLKQHVPDIGAVGDDPTQRPGIVHRLDKEVSGVMVIAKTQPAFEHLKQQFQSRTIKKEYVALVHGIPEKTSGTIDFPIARSERQHGRMSARPKRDGDSLPDDNSQGREAITHYEIERKVKNNALLRVNIETGRTHQIRVHLKAIGHPIVGDTVYTTKPFRKKRNPDPISRPWLHSHRLQFTDLAGKKQEFTAPIPEELQRVI